MEASAAKENGSMMSQPRAANLKVASVSLVLGKSATALNAILKNSMVVTALLSFCSQNSSNVALEVLMLGNIEVLKLLRFTLSMENSLLGCLSCDGKYSTHQCHMKQFSSHFQPLQNMKSYKRAILLSA